MGEGVQCVQFTGIDVVFTTFLILFGSGMVVQNVVWYFKGLIV